MWIGARCLFNVTVHASEKGYTPWFFPLKHKNKISSLHYHFIAITNKLIMVNWWQNNLHWHSTLRVSNSDRPCIYTPTDSGQTDYHLNLVPYHELVSKTKASNSHDYCIECLSDQGAIPKTKAPKRPDPSSHIIVSRIKTTLRAQLQISCSYSCLDETSFIWKTSSVIEANKVHSHSLSTTPLDETCLYKYVLQITIVNLYYQITINTQKYSSSKSEIWWGVKVPCTSPPNIPVIKHPKKN